MTASASHLASQTLNEYWDGYLPVDPAAIAGRAGVYVISEPMLDREGISGDCYIDDNGAPVIRFNPYDNERRQRFTIAHELGHVLQKHVSQGGRMHRDPKRDYQRFGETPMERQANEFAAQLLMPESVLRLAARAMPDIDRLAAEFNVSTKAMGYRLQNIGMLLDDRRAVIW